MVYEEVMLGLVIEVTDRCNLNCKWCGVKRGKSSLSYSQIISIINQNNPRFVEFTGGEPLLNKDIFRLIDYCKSSGMLVSLNTNGTLIDDRIIGRINADIVRISIDGLEEVNDNIRGKGSFRKTIKAINLLSKVKKRLNKKTKIIISTAVGKTNRYEARKIIKYFYPEVKRFMFGRVLPTPELGYSECINRFEAFKVWLSLLPYRLNPSLRVNFVMQFGALIYFSFVPPEIRSDGKVISCCINRGDVIGDIKDKNKLKSKPCLLCFSSCRKCIDKYFKNDTFKY